MHKPGELLTEAVAACAGPSYVHADPCPAIYLVAGIAKCVVAVAAARSAVALVIVIFIEPPPPIAQIGSAHTMSGDEPRRAGLLPVYLLP
jgi:hypothetical protein